MYVDTASEIKRSSGERPTASLERGRHTQCAGPTRAVHGAVPQSERPPVRAASAGPQPPASAAMAARCSDPVRCRAGSVHGCHAAPARWSGAGARLSRRSVLRRPVLPSADRAPDRAVRAASSWQESDCAWRASERRRQREHYPASKLTDIPRCIDGTRAKGARAARPDIAVVPCLPLQEQRQRSNEVHDGHHRSRKMRPACAGWMTRG